ncbi:arrestin domain-containing protein 17-like [Bolinopsis microptera]|uniref:arrestin domain-containing protein 17-like n=1 Tax=Bolinopsis microptera TaxID=2820187 RepID=UPI003078E361
MGKSSITKFEIRLHNPLAVYYAGQTIAGQVFLELAADLYFPDITLEMHGDANVAWTEEEGSRDNLRTVRYKNSETYLNIELYLIGVGKKERKLQAGRHNLPFSIALPINLPSTFIGDHGRVQYNLTVKIDDFLMTIANIDIDVTVVSLLDLNQDPNCAASPRTISGSKKFGFLCCTSGPLRATLSFPKLGWVGGETLSFSVSIENLSNKVMTKSTIQLIERDIFTSSCGRQRTVNKTILTRKRGRIAPGASFTWSNVELLLPPLPPSHLIHCNIIDIMYTVVLSVHPSWLGSDLNVPVNITIGTIPLRQQVQHINYQYQPDRKAPPPAISAPPPDISAPTPDINAPPLPSYEEMVHGGAAM